jgi:VWFA-related protein
MVVILLDGSIPNGAPVVAATKIAHAAIDQLGPGDLAAVVRSSVFSGNGRSQGFTSDRARLRMAIDSPFMGSTDPPTMTQGGLVSPSPVSGGLFQTQLQCEVILNLSRAMREAPHRRKLLLFIGSRLALGGEITVDGERRHCRDDMMRELIGSNVTVHVVDPVGVLTRAVAAEYLGRVSPGLVQQWSVQNQVRIDTLRVLPSLTGGRAVVHTNTPDALLPPLLQESTSYYLLGFDPHSLAAKTSGHNIRVEVKRRGVTVHSRTSYADADRGAEQPAASNNSGASDPVSPEIEAALERAAPLQGLPLTVTVAPFATSHAPTAAVAITVGTTISRDAGPHRVAMTVAAFDDRGRGVAVRNQLLEVRAGRQLAAVRSMSWSPALICLRARMS